MADEGPTKDELYERATELNVEGRSSMSKDELAAAIEDAEAANEERKRSDDFVTPRDDQFQEKAVVYGEEGEDRVTGDEIEEPSGEGPADQSSLTPDTGGTPPPPPPPAV